jgi:dihydrofolate synthase/folylpolyglutamate synthase
MNDGDKLKDQFNPAATQKEIESFVADAAGGDYSAVKEFLQKHKDDVDKKNEEGWSALRWTARYGHRLVVEVLLDNGAAADIPDRDLMSALSYAARGGYTDISKLLMDKGADINRKNKAGWTPLMLAVKNDHTMMVKLLLGKDNLLLDEKNEDGDTALMLAAWNKHAGIAEMLVKAGASLDVKDSAGKTALELAKVSDDPAIVKLLEKATEMSPHWTYSPDKDVEEALSLIQKKYPPLYTGGIERTVALLGKLGNPHLTIPSTFHVAGTNGKGSTLAFLQAIFEAGGLSVHKYTSPHLVRFEERFVLNGQMIGQEMLLSLLEDCVRAAEGLEVSFFEFSTVLMFLAAARTKADVLLLETGLGGTLDATNVLPSTTGIITRISFDHTQILGNTLPAIAVNKAGIMRKGCPCIIARQPEAAVMKVFEDEAERCGAQFFRAGHEWRTFFDEQGFCYESSCRKFELPLPALKGAHQIDNAGAAIAALERSAFSFLLKQDILAAAMKRVSWPGRMQRLTTGPATALLPAGWELWLDGAHNDSGAEILVAQAQAWGKEKPLHIITAMKHDKDAAAFFHPLAPHLCSTTVILEEIVGEPMMDSRTLCDHLTQAGVSNVNTHETLESAVQNIARKYPSPQRILIAGSLYLAGHVLRTHN